MLIVDAQEDLAWNILTFNRDYYRSSSEIRLSEREKISSKLNGDTVLGWPEYQKGQVALVFASLFATPSKYKMGDWDTQCYTDVQQAKTLYQRQLATYIKFVDESSGRFALIREKSELQILLSYWANSKNGSPVGLVLTMEGAEAIASLDELPEWWEAGVRIIGPGWSDAGFCGSTNKPGPLTAKGFALLEAMNSIDIALDISHMDEKSVLQAMDMYSGNIVATHANVKSLLRGTESNRHLSDRVISGLLDHDGIIGIIPYNRYLVVDWQDGDLTQISLDHVVAHIDYVCQLAGDAKHVGIGSDFDGGFGLQSIPFELDTIADLQKLIPLLIAKGYSDEEIELIMGKNWLRFILGVLPERL